MIASVLPLITIVLLLFASSSLAAQSDTKWIKTVKCPSGRVYRDVSEYAGNSEFCELRLHGALWVKDGPSRWWYSKGHLGGEGGYDRGRKIGRWKECTRFDKCRITTYPPLTQTEREHHTRDELPVRHIKGKYWFDFQSCRSTWLTHETNGTPVDLNVINGVVRCQITYIFNPHPNGPPERSYFCDIPYSVGLRGFNSLDLKAELTSSGLPQFCRPDDTRNPEADYEANSAITFWADMPFVDEASGREATELENLASSNDDRAPQFVCNRTDSAIPQESAEGRGLRCKVCTRQRRAYAGR